MIHINYAPDRNYEVYIEAVFDEQDVGLTGFPIGTGFNATLQELWGELVGVFCEIESTWTIPAYECTFMSPAGSTFTTGSVAGLLSSGKFRLYFTKYKEVVRADCSYTVSWDSVDVYLTINGGSESLVATHGSYSHTSAAGAYDERLNCTKGDLVNTPVDTPSVLTCEDVAIDAHSYVDVTVGYRYQDQSDMIWHTDPVLVDAGTAFEDCETCALPLGDITAVDNDSYSVSFYDHWEWTIVDGVHVPYLCHCVTGQVSGYQFHKVGDFSVRAARSVYVKDKRIVLPDQRIQTAWTCDDDGVTDSDSDDDTTSPSETTCASLRGAYHRFWDLCCTVPDLVGCGADEGTGITGCEDFPPDCPDHYCIYNAARDLSWPTLPPCSPSAALDYSVSRAQRHAISTRSDAGKLIIYFSATNGPYAWGMRVKTLDIDWARICYSQFGILNRLWVLWLAAGSIELGYIDQEADAVAMATTIGTGDYGDHTMLPNGTLWVYRLDGGTVYGSAYDGTGTLMIADTATNLTGLDTAQITAENSVNSVNRSVIGLTFSLGSTWYMKTAVDGLNFS